MAIWPTNRKTEYRWHVGDGDDETYTVWKSTETAVAKFKTHQDAQRYIEQMEMLERAEVKP